MKVDTEPVEKIQQALCGWMDVASMDTLVGDKIQEHIAQTAYKIHQHDKTDRSIFEVAKCCSHGVYGEFSIKLMLEAAGLDPKWNLFDTSKEYVSRDRFCYDIICLGLKIEVKTFRYTPKRTSFSYHVDEDKNGYQKIKNFYEHANDYDILIAVVHNDMDEYHPWIIIDNAAIRDYFQPSEHFAGWWYLPMKPCYKRKEVGYIQRCFPEEPSYVK